MEELFRFILRIAFFLVSVYLVVILALAIGPFLLGMLALIFAVALIWGIVNWIVEKNAEKKEKEFNLDEFISEQHQESNVEQEPTKEPIRPNRNDVESSHQNNNQSHSTRTPELKPHKARVRRNISHIPYSELKPQKKRVQRNVSDIPYSELKPQKKRVQKNIRNLSYSELWTKMTLFLRSHVPARALQNIL